MPVYSVTSLQPPQPGSAAFKAIDGDINTIYHSLWSQSGIPDELNFYFDSQVNSINEIIYIPRQSGFNGIWTNVTVSYSTKSNPNTFIPIATNLIWPSNNQNKSIPISPAIQEPFAIKFQVHQGTANFSTCAEMEFFSNDPLNPVFNGVDCNFSTANLIVNGANDIEATIFTAGSIASSFQSGSNIDKSFDNDMNTLYHSAYGNTVFPVDLTYRLNGTTPIDYLKYFPRPSGANGFFGNVEISYNTTGNPIFQTLMSFNFAQSGLPTIVNFPQQITPLNIRISVQDGYNNFASCAEMKFYTKGSLVGSYSYGAIFADDLYSVLQPGITQASIDTITAPFFQSLAQCLLDESYIHQYRVQSYEVFPTLASISQSLKVASYDNFENVTGIVFEQGEKIALFARDIPPNANVFLTVKDFLTGMNNGPVGHYQLQNGLNVFQLANGGTGYISYFNNDLTLNNVDINIVSGKVNGYFDSQTSTATEWIDLLSNTAYSYLDIRGKHAHLVYQKESLRNGSPLDGFPLIGKYDTILKHQQLQMGLDKFNRTIKNRILTYNEYGGGYYAGGLGIHLDLGWGEAALTDPTQLGLWGIAHEYGHINQIRPDITWKGTVEVTVNIYSVWADYHMNSQSHPYTRLERENISPNQGIAATQGGRINGAILNTTVLGRHLQDTTSYDVFKILVPFWQLQTYYSLAGASRNAPILSLNNPLGNSGVDYAHWYGTVAETARNSNTNGLTNGEYLLNFVKNTCDAVQEDLTDFFIQTGFLKPINMPINDYGIGWLTITQLQIDQTIADVQSKGYAQPVSPVIHYASAHSMQMFRDQLPLSGVTGIGVTLSGNYLTTQHTDWLNAVAYETFDSSGNLIFVSISGTGDLNNLTTKIYYPNNALAVYAVGYDGQRILVYPATTLGMKENNQPLLRVSPNPISDASQFKIYTSSDLNEYALQIVNMNGAIIFDAYGNKSSLEAAVKQILPSLSNGLYILSLTDTSEGKVFAKLIKN